MVDFMKLGYLDMCSSIIHFIVTVTCALVSFYVALKKEHLSIVHSNIFSLIIIIVILFTDFKQVSCARQLVKAENNVKICNFIYLFYPNIWKQY